MTIASISVLRQKLPPFLSTAFIHQQRFISAAARHHQSPINVRRQQQQKQQQPDKNVLRARDTFKKQLSSLAPLLSLDEKPPLTENQAVGTVVSSQANFMRVVVNSASQSEDSGSWGLELLCVVKDVLKKIKRRVHVGDRVLVGSIDWVDRGGRIENVFERKSEILDPPVANVDHLLVFFSFEQPKIEQYTLTRFLVEAESTGIPLTLALNKAELVEEGTLKEWKSRLRDWGYEPVFCSVDAKRGMDTLQFILREQTSVIVGPSGVGKSSLINALRGSRSVLGAVEDDNRFEPILGSKWSEEQRVGEVSTRSGRGKHTTRNVSLLPLSGGGYLADTPGFNQPSLMKVTKQSLSQYFPEIRKILEQNGPGKCSFSDCLHIGEPGCLVKGDWERFPYYFQLLDEIKIREEFQLRTFGTKRESGVRERNRSKQLERERGGGMRRAFESAIRSVGTVADCPRLTRLSLHAPKSVEVEFDNGNSYNLSAEYLRVYSPAVDSKIRSIGGEKVISGRSHVGIMSAEPVGNYGVRLLFDDLHKTGIFTWDYFYYLGNNKFSLMRNYIKTLKKRGLNRDPTTKK